MALRFSSSVGRLPPWSPDGSTPLARAHDALPDWPAMTDPETPVCSAKGCRAPAIWALRWNNPKLHPPQRRKTWLACADHRESLTDFLQLRGFLREVDPL